MATTVLLFDRKSSWEAVSEFAMSKKLPILLLQSDEIPIACYQPPSSKMDFMQHISLLLPVISRCLSLEASQRVVLDCILSMSKDYDLKTQFPSWSEVLRVVEQRISDRGSSRESQYAESTSFALKQLLINMPNIDYRYSDSLYQIAHFPGMVVIGTASLTDQSATFLAALFLYYVYQRRYYHPEECEDQFFVVLDDALSLIRGSYRSEEEGSSLNPIVQNFFMGRSKNVGGVVSCQDVSIVSPTLRVNCASWVCCGAKGDDWQHVAKQFHLTPEQANELQILEPGEVVFLTPEWNLAMKGYIPYIPEARISEDFRKSLVSEFLSGIKSFKHTKQQPKPVSTDIPEDSKRILLKVASEPGVMITRLYSQLSMDSNRGKKAIDWLTKNGYAREIQLSRDKGGVIVTLELLDKAVSYLAQIDIAPAPMPLKGGWRHSFYALWLKRMADAEGKDCKFEVWFYGIQMDVVLTDRNGVMVGYQVVVSERKTYSAEKAIQCSKIDGLSKTVFLFEKNEMKKSAEKELKKHKEYRRDSLGLEFVGAYSDWA